MSDITNAIGDILRIQRLLNGPPAREVVLGGVFRYEADGHYLETT
ncbi:MULTISPECIES: hypothetical protein [unclassified Frankia]|nr:MULTISPECIES: hypothetical protein [unclassified Frankia]